MSKILPRKSDSDISKDNPYIVDLGSKEAEVVLDALSSKTTRDIFLHIYENPSTKSEIASEFDGTIQNIKYHTDKLQKSGLIEIKRTDYSEKGKEMDVYGPTYEAVVLLASDDEINSRIKNKIKPLILTLFSGLIISLSILLTDVVRRTKEKVKIESSDTDGVGSFGSESNNESKIDTITTTVETSENIVLGFIELNPSIAITLAILIGILIGSVIYFIFDNMILQR